MMQIVGGMPRVYGSCMDTRHPSLVCRQVASPSAQCLGATAHRQPRHRLQVSAAIKKRSEKNVVCVKVLHAKPQHINDVHKLCEQLLTNVQQAKSDCTSGLLAFECSNDRWDSSVFHFWERYESNAALGRFNNRDDIKNFMIHVQRYLEQPVGMALYEWRDGELGPPCVQGGPKGEGGLDDATGAGGRGGAGYTQTSRAVDLGAARVNLKDDESGAGWLLERLTKQLKLPWVRDDGVAK